MPVIHGPQYKKHCLRDILKFSEKLIYFHLNNSFPLHLVLVVYFVT